MKRALWMIVALALAACRPDSIDSSGLVLEPRVLAVQSEPAEAAPGSAVRFRALVALSDAEPVGWSFCGAPKSPNENNAVAAECVNGDGLTFVGRGSEIEANVPSDACSRFGPDTPPGNFRPRDADITGGYYQPLRVDLAGAPPVFYLQRVRCALAEATADSASELAATYLDNRNPTLEPLVAGEGVSLERIPRGARIELVSGWPEAAAEPYRYFDRSTQQVIERREAMQMSWFVSAGELARESTGRAEDDPLTLTTNEWLAPDQPGTSELWLVLRDSRGGVTFASYELVVTP